MGAKKQIRNGNLKYEKCSDKEVLFLYDFFSKMVEKFMKAMEYPSDTDYAIDAYSLIDAIVRVDKRKAYFICFHNMLINEKKEAALYAYWFIKCKPFSIADERYCDDKNSSRINELFAAYIIYATLLFDDEEFTKIVAKKEEGKFTYHDKLMYSLHYRCFTIDSIMFLVDTITPESFEIEYDVEP